MGDEFVDRREAIPGLDRHHPRRAVGFRPERNHEPEIDERIALRGEFPVDDGGDLTGIRAEHHVGKVVVAVDDARG